MQKIKFYLTILSHLAALFMLSVVCVGFLVLSISASLPDTQQIKDIELKVPLRVYSADKQLISEFGNERRKSLRIEDTPDNIINALLAAEDNSFYSHFGVDISGLFRAFLSNLISSQRQQGASTITMQVARNFFLSREKTYDRKFKEILLAIKLEQVLSKNEILSLYLNKIFLGYRAYGFAAAADVYYGKDLTQLSLAETAMLAGLPKAPSSNNPLRNPARAVNRRNYVLNRMLDQDYISKLEYQQSTQQPITAKRHARNFDHSAPHISEMVRAYIIKEFGEQGYWQGLNVYTTLDLEKQHAAELALRKGLQNYDKRHGFRGAVKHIDLATIDLDNQLLDLLESFPQSKEQIPVLVSMVSQDSAQVLTKYKQTLTISLENSMWARSYKSVNSRGERPSSMESLVQAGDIIYIQPEQAITEKIDLSPEQISQIQTWQLSQLPNLSGSLISIEPKTGRIVALVGGYDFFLNKYNRAVQSIRQPGSNIKPFIYSASLAKGYTPASMISGAPIVIPNRRTGTVWRPEDYSGKFFGPTRLRVALSKSMNLISIRLLRSIGIPYAMEYLRRFGVDTKRFAPNLTMALGAGGITPLEMITAYTGLANGGYKIKPFYIDTITDRNGAIVYQSKTPEFCDVCYYQQTNKQNPDLELTISTKQTSSDTIEPLDNPDNQDTTQAIEQIDNAEHQQRLHDELNNSYQAPRIMSRANNFLIVDLLKEVIRTGTGRKAQALNRQDLAGKTGTTNDYYDAWFSGFNSSLATTVWVGFDQPSTLGKGETGGKAALPIWVDYMKVALNEVPQDQEVIPASVETKLINKYTGRFTNQLDPDALQEYFAIPDFVEEYYDGDLPQSDDTLLDDESLNTIDMQQPSPQEGLLPPVDSETSSEPMLSSELPLNPDAELSPEQTPEMLIEAVPETTAPIIQDNVDTEGLF